MAIRSRRNVRGGRRMSRRMMRGGTACQDFTSEAACTAYPEGQGGQCTWGYSAVKRTDTCKPASGGRRRMSRRMMRGGAAEACPEGECHTFTDEDQAEAMYGEPDSVVKMAVDLAQKGRPTSGTAFRSTDPLGFPSAEADWGFATAEDVATYEAIGAKIIEAKESARQSGRGGRRRSQRNKNQKKQQRRSSKNKNKNKNQKKSQKKK